MRGIRHGGTRIVEILQVDTPGRLGTPLARPTARRRRWRWIAPLAIVGVIGTAVLWPERDQPAVPAALTTSLPPPALVAPASTAEDVASPLLPLTPDGMLPTMLTTGGAAARGIAELWTRNGAAFAGSGWFIVQAVPGLEVGAGERRLKIDDNIVVIGSDHGVRRLSYAVGGRWTVHLWARLTDADLIRLAGQVVVVDGTVVSIGDRAGDFGLAARLGDADAGGDVWGPGPAGVTLRFAGVSGDEWTNVWVTPVSAARGDLAGFLLPYVARGGGRYGFIDDDGRVLTLSEQRAGQTITIQTTRPLGEAIAVARTIHPAAAGEWERLLGERATQQPEVTAMVATGTMAGGAELWRIMAAPGSDAAALRLLAVRGSDNTAAEPGEYAVSSDEPAILPVADRAATYLLALIPPGVGGARFEVSVGAATYTAAQSDLRVGQWHTAGVAFPELGPWTARLIAADGLVLTTLDGGA